MFHDGWEASRKVQRCGFLFVAPDWDFSNPLNRTKRWQRRWFVLYDDGELTYSVDDHPETVPHGVIDMSKVLEVADAEDVTGNSYSVALTAPDRVTFIKGTCRDESRWWMDALDVYTTAMVKDRCRTRRLAKLARQTRQGRAKSADTIAEILSTGRSSQLQSADEKPTRENDDDSSVGRSATPPSDVVIGTDRPDAGDAVVGGGDTTELRVNLPAEELLRIKKGWLMKLTEKKTWAKHWFVLRGTSLILYRDTGAEDLNVTDGLIDLNGAQWVEECETEKNYGFQITESLRSSLRSDSLYSGRLEDNREPFTAGLDRSKLRSSLRTLPTEPSTGGHDPVLSRLRQRIAVLEADRSEAERQARRASLVRQVREQLETCVGELQATEIPEMVEAFSSLLAEHLGSLEESAALLRPTGAGTGAGAGGSSAPARRTPAVQQDRQLRRLHHSLLKQESEVTAAVTAFKTDKLSRLAESLAAETLLGGQQPPADDDQLLEEEKVRDAWNMAQNTITEEMVEAEMSTMMLKFVELYERDLEVDRQHCFLLVQAQQQLAERRYTVATDSLRAEMEEAVMALSQRYETALARLRAAPEPPPPPPADQSDRLLAELADVVAQKAIVDGYLSVISDEDESGSDATLEIIEEDPAGDRAVPLDTSLQRDSALAVFFGEGASASDQAELQHLYRAAVERCRGELSDYGVAIPAGQTLDEFCERTQETVAAVRAECTAQLQQERNRHKEQALCEKGLVAMENSHRRIIADLEEKHHRELRALEAEKQQALAEETQATLAALDALRKAHETEVQREICKFKDEFIKKMQPTLDVGKLQKEHVAEMGDIKGEILSLSEKYSIKCLETASLEEKVETQTRSLQEANQRVFQLDARNKQLRAQLSANISELSEGSRVSAHGSGGSSDAEEQQPRLRRGASLNPARIRELMRSPSCPRLTGSVLSAAALGVAFPRLSPEWWPLAKRCRDADSRPAAARLRGSEASATDLKRS
ncbi:Protein outspread [Amphibalanus amphitrite]|uniref:Protein outspread n=1 Tax=Amphibalanus amphitrite TaxID=1232801 RepID=A0A6A4VRS8_AMPAM|nr:Protein outspread [Amphibalanus amphitrite]